MIKNKNILFGVVAVALLAAGIWLYSGSNNSLGTAADSAGVTEVTMYKNPGCQCCTYWANHLEENGFTVTEQPTSELVSLKMDRDVPYSLHACHTAVVGDYVVEGHVPAEDVQRMLQERPDISGIGVGGMPIGSPGMEGPNPEPYTVYAFDSDGNRTVWAKHQQSADGTAE